MGVKRIVDDKFWQDPTVIESYSVEDKYFLLYLMTNPKVSITGIYLLPKKYMAFEMGYSLDTVNVLLDRFQNKYKNVIYCEGTQEIAVLNSLKYSIVSGGKPLLDLMKRDLGRIENADLILAVYRHLSKWWDESGREIDTSIKTLYIEELKSRSINLNEDCKDTNEDYKVKDVKKEKSRLSNEYEYEYEYEYEDSLHDSSSDSCHDSCNDSQKQIEKKPSAFDDFWSIYPKKVGKKAALKAWEKLRPSKELQERIINAVEQQKKSEQWNAENGRYIPNPATWINQGRWDDELAMPKGNGRASKGTARTSNRGNYEGADTFVDYNAAFGLQYPKIREEKT